MTLTLDAPTLAKPSLAADFLLARLLAPTKKPPGPGKVRAELSRFFREPLADGQWDTTLNELRAAGLIDEKLLRLTEAGRARALEFLGVSELPQRCNWGTIQAKYLVPKALGISENALDVRERIAKFEGLAALRLKRQFELATGANPTLNQVLEAIVCSKLGYPGETSLSAVKAIVLNRLIESEKQLDLKTLQTQVPRVRLNTGKILELRGTILREWIGGSQAPPQFRTHSPISPEPVEFDIQSFANTVRAAARDCPTGRFGDNKVFIHHVWRRLTEEPGFPRMDLPTFKQRLVEANNTHLLTLSRADLVEVMDPTDVSESKTGYLNATFNFILIEKEPS